MRSEDMQDMIFSIFKDGYTSYNSLPTYKKLQIIRTYFQFELKNFSDLIDCTNAPYMMEGRYIKEYNRTPEEDELNGLPTALVLYRLSAIVLIDVSEWGLETVLDSSFLKNLENEFDTELSLLAHYLNNENRRSYHVG